MIYILQYIRLVIHSMIYTPRYICYDSYAVVYLPCYMCYDSYAAIGITQHHLRPPESHDLPLHGNTYATGGIYKATRERKGMKIKKHGVHTARTTITQLMFFVCMVTPIMAYIQAMLHITKEMV